MSCDEWMRGEYWIRNKTEYNKLIKAIVQQYNKDIVAINEAIKDYKASAKNRYKIDWRKFNEFYSIESWRLEDLIKENWKRRSGIPKATTKTLEVSCVTFNPETQTIKVEVPEDNWAVERWHNMPGVEGLFAALEQVKWSKRGDKDGGYLTYWNEYFTAEGNGEPDFPLRYFFGRRGNAMRTWLNSRPPY